MTERAYKRAKPFEVVRADLAARLRTCTASIEFAIFTRIESLSEPIEDLGPVYIAGVRSAIAGALEYGIESLEGRSEKLVQIPVEATTQARQAARMGVRLDSVLRRYVAGNKAFEEFIVAEADELSAQALCRVLGDLGPPLDRLMESVAVEYRNESDRVTRSSVEDRTDRILQFLEGSRLVGPDDVDYDFDAWHVGLIHSGQPAAAVRALRSVAVRQGYRLLNVARNTEVVWTWLGRPAEPDVATLIRHLSAEMPDEAPMAIGEPRKGVAGWRQTFWEAHAAFEVMLYRRQPVTRCRDVILASAVMSDPALTTSLIETFLAPLDGPRQSGGVLRETLRAYFTANQNANTTAAALGVARHTVERRLRNVEKKLGQTLDTCGAQLQIALGVEELILPETRIHSPFGV